MFGLRLGWGDGADGKSDPLPAPVLSFRNRSASPEGGRISSFDHAELLSFREYELMEYPELDSGGFDGVCRPIGRGTLRGLTPTPGKDAVRDGSTNLSTTDKGGDFGRDVRMGRLPGEPVMESRC